MYPTTTRHTPHRARQADTLRHAASGNDRNRVDEVRKVRMVTSDCAHSGVFPARRALLAFVGGLGVLLALNLGSGGRAQAQTATTAAVLQAQVDALNRGDAAAAAALFSPRAVVIGASDCFPAACVGNAAIAQHFLNQANQHLQGTLVSEYVDGSTATGRLEARLDVLAAAGVERIVAIYTIIVQDGHIVLWSVLPDPSDPQTAQFLASQQPG